MKIIRLLVAASAAFFIAFGAHAQNVGTVTNHAVAIGKGAGVQGFTSALCTSAQLLVGQTSADPLCKTITGDITLTAAGAVTVTGITLPSAANGDVYFRSGGVLTRLPIGTNGQVLGVSSLLPAWVAASSAASVTVGSTTINSGTNNRLLYDNSGTLGEAVVSTGLSLSGGILTTSLSTATNSLGADVTLNNTGTFFTGPSVAQGTSGTWFCSGTATVTDTGNAAGFVAKLWDGTTVISSVTAWTSAASLQTTIPLSGILTAPAANIRISIKDVTTTTGKIIFNTSGESKDSTLTCNRIG